MYGGQENACVSLTAAIGLERTFGAGEKSSVWVHLKKVGDENHGGKRLAGDMLTLGSRLGA